MGLNIRVTNKRVISEPKLFKLNDFLNYREMMSYVGYYNLVKKLDVILSISSECPLFICNTQFSNIDYMFNYIDNKTSLSTNLSSSIFAGGKGFNMYKSICSALGESFERFMACLETFEIESKLVTATYKELIEKGYNALSPKEINFFSDEQFEEDNFLFDKFDSDTVVSWFETKSISNNKSIYFPTCLIQMYYYPKKIYTENNQELIEKRIGYSTSGGLTSHFDKNTGIEHGLQEIIERHEINLSWYCKNPPKKIILDNVLNEKLKSYLPYIEENKITFYRHNVDQENFHVVTAMSFDKDLARYSFNTGGGVNIDIEKAILGALDEYSQSINNTRKIIYAPEWLTSKFSNSILEVNEGDDPKYFKTFYQAVSYYGLKKYNHKLDWYTKSNKKISLSELIKTQNKMIILNYLEENNIEAIYFDLEISKRFKHIFISKVYMTKFSPAFIAGTPALGHPSYRKYLCEGGELTKEILPFP